jgi:FkbM family methyltransferase
MIKQFLKTLLLNVGYNVSKYDSKRNPKAVFRYFIKKNNINVVFDVGANSGQYARQLRAQGYKGKIISFEPLTSAYEKLELASKHDTAWKIRNCALGNKREEKKINIAGNSWSSSFLNMLPSHSQEAPDSVYIDNEIAQVETLDAIFANYVSEGENVLLKIDTQGYTRYVLDGASKSIEKIKGALLELSLMPLYENEPLIGEAINIMYEKGFTLVFLEPEFTNSDSGQQLQVNGLFFRM